MRLYNCYCPLKSEKFPKNMVQFDETEKYVPKVVEGGSSNDEIEKDVTFFSFGGSSRQNLKSVSFPRRMQYID